MWEGPASLQIQEANPHLLQPQRATLSSQFYRATLASIPLQEAVVTGFLAQQILTHNLTPEIAICAVGGLAGYEYFKDGLEAKLSLL